VAGLSVWRCQGQNLQLFSGETARKDEVEHVFAIDPADGRVYWWRDERFTPFCARRKICRSEGGDTGVKVVYRTEDAKEVDILRIDFASGDWLMLLDGPNATFSTSGTCQRSKSPTG
jgi:hypothetical protein